MNSIKLINDPQIDSLEACRNCTNVQLLHCMVNGVILPDLQLLKPILHEMIHTHETQSAYGLDLPRVRTQTAKSSFLAKATSLCNSLPKVCDPKHLNVSISKLC